jgi:hypothetical protein
MAAAPETVLGHWSTLIEGLQEAPLEFYKDVEAAVVRRCIPDAKFERIEYKEGGAFSGLRQYLRIRRHREVFDVCVAPFGNGCFVSWWLAEVRPALPTIASILIVFGYLAVMGIFANQLGTFQGPIVFLLFVPIALFAVSRMGTQQADDFILMLPLIGKLYERFFRPITYYRIDTSEMFQTSVRRAVDEVIDRLTTAKGLRALTELERKPVLRDFFRK